MAKRPILTKLCTYCNEEYVTKEADRKFCSVGCKNKQQSIDNKGRKGVSRYGPDNSNYGKKWTNEQRKAQSRLVKSKVDDEYRRKCGTANKGVKFSAERVARMHGNRTPESYSHPHTNESKRKISAKSKEKFHDPEYTTRVRAVMEERGHWLSKDLKTDYELYYEESNWKFRMFDLLYESKRDMIDDRGIYNSYSNTKGVVRDHMLSRHTGFVNGVYPEIMRHIENCDIIPHADNVSKRFTTRDSITIEELLERIINTKYQWPEQSQCLVLIEEYRNGKKWKRKEV